MMATVSLARRFGRFSIGLAADLIAVYAGREAGYRLTGIPQVGLTVEAMENWTIGVHTFNPFIQNLGRDANRRALPAIYALGSDWRFRHDMRWTVDASYDVRSTYRIATGLEWHAIEQLTAKVGVYYQRYVVACLGMALHFNNLRLDINSELHPVLGVTMQARIGVLIDK